MKKYILATIALLSITACSPSMAQEQGIPNAQDIMLTNIPKTDSETIAQTATMFTQVYKGIAIECITTTTNYQRTDANLGLSCNWEGYNKRLEKHLELQEKAAALTKETIDAKIAELQKQSKEMEARNEETRI